MRDEGKVYMTVGRPAMLYVGGQSETWAVKKAQKLDVADCGRNEKRWKCEITKLNGIRNERILVMMKVGKISRKVQERRLKWYGHVMIYGKRTMWEGE